MATRKFATKTLINKPIEEVFDFFSKAENLNRITPPHLHFKILTPLPIVIEKGSVIDYRIKLFGVPFYWKTKIIIWEPPFRFLDSQLKGPYIKWEHEHRFESEGKNTIMFDTVEYKSPGLLFEPILHKIFIKRNVEQIFQHRGRILGEIFK